MKFKKIPGVLLLALAFSACQKEAMTDTQSLENQDTGARLSGVVADDPKEVAKIPVTLSYEFAKNGIHSSTVSSVAGRGKPPTTTADLTAPVVTITSPASGSNVTGTVNITASASDNVGVKSVSFTVNNGTAVSDAIAPYATSYNFVNDGSYTITARATDAAGNIKFILPAEASVLTIDSVVKFRDVVTTVTGLDPADPEGPVGPGVPCTP